KKVGPFTLDDSLSASGSFCLKKSTTKFGWQTGSTVFFGFFNSAQQGWRPPNFLGFELTAHTDTHAPRLEQRPALGFGLGTSKFTAGADLVSSGGSIVPVDPAKQSDPGEAYRIPSDGTKLRWELRYDPTGAGGAGAATIVFGGLKCLISLPPPLRKHGATFDRFGIFNNQIAGCEMEIYLDDLTINGQFDDFTNDPGWEGKGNRQLIQDTREYGAQDYGYSSETNHAGGARPGEIGGFFQSVDPWEIQFQGYYGDRIGPLSLQHKLTARGKFASRQFMIDSTFALGWFNSSGQGWPLKNFVGVFFDSLSDTGRIVQPLYGTSEGTKARGRDYVTFMPDGTSYEWTLEYDPDGADGRGLIRFTMNGQTVTQPLAEGDKQKGATFDRFGVFNLGWANSKHCVVWFDDITYTAGAE
ncbi:MAG TPA: hypothetical protein VNL70_09735, partial [Tepidisphaeraceae bacterium]|nr:hypothetical protein [Tepidisphaeraceae bacterium]